MQKLSGADASYLYNETINTPQHVGGIQYLDVPEDLRETFFASLRSVLLSRAHAVPYLTSRIQPMPWNIDHPVWVRHTQFDIDEHLHALTLDAPGTTEQLEEKCAELYEPLLDRSKPLWEMWVIDGLENGQIAVMSKTHHACIDGMASVSLGEILGDLEPTIREFEAAPPSFWVNDDVSYPNLMRESWFNLARYNVERWSQWPAQARANARIAEMQVREAAERPVAGPQAPWNASIDARRAVAGAQFSLSTLKAIGKTAGAKVNDVVLAITAEALNRYLERENIKLDDPLIAGCPVSLRKPGDATMNNQVTMMMVSLESHIDDPIQRLRSIHAAANSSKQMLNELGDAVQTDFGGPFVPAQMQAVAQAGQSGEYADRPAQVPMNLVVSNVPGLTVPLYSAGARVLGTTPLSIVAHGAGLNVTVGSYMDRMDLGLTAASKVIPDVRALRDDFVAAYEDLARATLQPEIEVVQSQAATQAMPDAQREPANSDDHLDIDVAAG